MRHGLSLAEQQLVQPGQRPDEQCTRMWMTVFDGLARERDIYIYIVYV